jgi:uncharacterized membrane protein YuzA (DUF378 family)
METLKSKKGVSTSIVGIILIIVGIAVMIGLIIYFSSTGKMKTNSFIDLINMIKRGG